MHSLLSVADCLCMVYEYPRYAASDYSGRYRVLTSMKPPWMLCRAPRDFSSIFADLSAYPGRYTNPVFPLHCHVTRHKRTCLTWSQNWCGHPRRCQTHSHGPNAPARRTNGRRQSHKVRLVPRRWHQSVHRSRRRASGGRWEAAC